VVGFSPDTKEDVPPARLYSLVHNYLSGGYAVIYAAESNVSYPPIEEAIREQREQKKTYEILEYLTRRIGPRKVKHYSQRGLLTTIDPDSILPADASIKQLLRSMNSYIEDCEEKAPRDIKGVVLFNSPRNFFQKGEFDKFLEFEHKIGRRFNNNFQMICWYKRRWIQSLSFSQLISLLATHNRSIHKNVQYHTLNAYRTIELISEGINKALKQEHASDIIFETMRRRFNLDTSTIISSPNIFADVLKTMSPDSATSLIDAIKTEIENKLSFANINLETTRNSAIKKGKGEGLRGRDISSSSSKTNSSSTHNERTIAKRKLTGGN
jgi:hypothetical protein